MLYDPRPTNNDPYLQFNAAIADIRASIASGTWVVANPPQIERVVTRIERAIGLSNADDVSA